MLAADSNSDHASSYPTRRSATVDQPLNPRQIVPVGTGEHSFNKLSLNDDLKRLSHAGCKCPRHLAPQPTAPIASLRAGIDGVWDALLSARYVLEMFRRALPNGVSRRCLDRLANRLTKIITEAQKLSTS